MKPLKLEMTAFISYADTTLFDLCRFDGKLFLITGKKGTGKTALFDAICFALYGRVSGSDRSALKPEQIHNRSCPLGQDTVVKFTFSHKGKEYTVTRSIHFRKKQGTADEYGPGQYNAVFEEEDGQTVIKGAGNVTGKVEELLALNYDQFRKIVMLAQGEFKDFLLADSEKKNEILGKLFDHSPYVSYAKLLSDASNRLEKIRAEWEQEIRSQMNGFVRPEDMEEFDEASWLPGTPELLENLCELVSLEQDRLKELEQDKKQKLEKRDEVRRELHQAKDMNQKLDDLAKQREQLEKLEAEEPGFQELGEKVSRMECAAHQIKPAYDNYAKTDTELKRIEEQITDNLAETERLTGQKKMAAAALVVSDEKKAEIQTNRDQAVSIRSRLTDYDAYDALAVEIRNGENAITTLNVQLSDVKERIRKNNDGTTLVKTELESLSTVDQELERVDGEVSRLKEKKDRMDSLKTICISVEQAEKEAAIFGENIQKLESREKEAEQQYDILFKRYIGGQAVLLAKGVRQKLEDCGRADCPVCGTALTRNHITSLPDGGDGVELSAVKQAEKERDAARKELQAEKEKALAICTQIKALKKQAMPVAVSVFGDGTKWEDFCAPADMAERVKASGQEYEAAVFEQNQLKIKKERIGQLQTRLIRYGEELSELTGQKGEIAASLESLEKQMEEKQNRRKKLQETLPYSTRLKAEEKAADLEQKAKKIETDLNGKIKALEEIEKSLSGASAKTETLMNTKKDMASQLEKTRDDLDAKVKESVFEGVSEAMELLDKVRDVEIWLSEKREEIKEHQIRLRNTRALIGRLEEDTKGKAMAEIPELENRKQKADDDYTMAEKTFTVYTSRCDAHVKIFQAVQEQKKHLAETDKASSMLKNLSDLASGTAGEGGKLSFDRYVMGAVFEEIMAMANQRLDVMTGGEYQLIHRVGADKNSKLAGLYIDVESPSSDFRIPADAASMSGGEKFIISLALAFGLSDVVRSHAGGISLETLFIDEGFGSLDKDSLNQVLKVLEGLAADGKHTIGLISHVADLEEWAGNDRTVRIRKEKNRSIIS